MGEPLTAAQRKAAEYARHKAAGRVAVMVFVYPETRERLRTYVRLLNLRAEKREREIRGAK